MAISFALMLVATIEELNSSISPKASRSVSKSPLPVFKSVSYSFPDRLSFGIYSSPIQAGVFRVLTILEVELDRLSQSVLTCKISSATGSILWKVCSGVSTFWVFIPKYWMISSTSKAYVLTIPTPLFTFSIKLSAILPNSFGLNLILCLSRFYWRSPSIVSMKSDTWFRVFASLRVRLGTWTGSLVDSSIFTARWAIFFWSANSSYGLT